MSSPRASKLRLTHQPTFNTSQPTPANDSIRTLAYDRYGKMLASVSANQTIKILKLVNSKWMEIQLIKYDPSGSNLCHRHQAAIIDICFAHPLFGSIFATLSRDKIIHIFELKLTQNNNDQQSFAFVQTACFKESVDIACCHFTPYHLGLKLAIVCKDGVVKIREARDISNLSKWMLSEQIIIDQNHMKPFHKLTFNPHLIQNKAMMHMNHKQDTKIFCISWNKNKFEFASFCVGANHNTLYIYGYTTNNRIHTKFNKTWKCIQKLVINSNRSTFDIHSVCWSNNIGKKYHLIGIGCNDGFIRVIKITKNVKRNENKQPFEWKLIYEQKIHKTSVCKLRWNICGTSMLSVSIDGSMYLLKNDRKTNEYVAHCINSEIQNSAINQGSDHKKEETKAAFNGFNVKNEDAKMKSNHNQNIKVNDSNNAIFDPIKVNDSKNNNNFNSDFEPKFGSNVNDSNSNSNNNSNNNNSFGSNFNYNFASNGSFGDNNASFGDNNASFGAFDSNTGDNNASFGGFDSNTGDNNASFGGFGAFGSGNVNNDSNSGDNNASFGGFGTFGGDSNNFGSWGNNNNS